MSHTVGTEHIVIPNQQVLQLGNKTICASLAVQECGWRGFIRSRWAKTTDTLLLCPRVTEARYISAHHHSYSITRHKV